MWAAMTIGMRASDELAHAKDLYRSAAYDEALGVLDGVVATDSTESIEVHEYRVFCLVALDRKDDAKRAMTTLITDHPAYVMSEQEASPRVRTMFTEVRRALLPSLVQKAYADAKASFDRKDPKAVAQFDGVLAGNPSLADLATVASGFRDLSKALATPEKPAPPAPVAATPAAPPPSAPRSVAPVMVPPVVISQPIPIPQIREEREWSGEVEVTINERGRVINARMTTPIHPVYDSQLVRAAMGWTYKPALRDGTPTTFVKQITIHVDTRPACTDRLVNNCRETP
jgi:hypothetical protein